MEPSGSVVAGGTLRRSTTHVAAVVLSLSAGVLAGCGPTEVPDPGSDVSEGSTASGPAGASPTAAPSAPTPAEQSDLAYAGAYDEAFRAGLTADTGQRVTLSGVVGDLADSRSAYELADPSDPDLDPLLVSARDPVPDLEIGDLVEVTGTVRNGFRSPAGTEGDEQADLYDQHLGDPYLDLADTKITDSPGP
ncbi:hypothetical protein GMA12_11355 [Kocuria sediminis]|uniref:Uncharacterized protein n=1 Tax=Kocuria sediminis TaxID=1038857 RepID=A0A6N8GR29_9MICC|nr:hypothetical protein [Kocuria sediminis]MUN63733.1 hypothetical protein [Kocuria sediminis]